MMLLSLLKELSLHPINAEELKGLILQLAVEGKLTANWRQENQNIRINIDELADVFKMTSEKLSEHSSSISELEVPQSWTKAKFSVVFDMKGGSQPPKSNFIDAPNEGYVQLYQIRDFGKKPQPVYVPIDSVSKLCTTDDIMIGRYGASIGKIFYGKDGAYNVALVKLIWNKELLLQDFVYQMFSARSIQDFFQNCTRSAQAGFNKTDMGELNITLPPLEEQKAIVEVVNQLFVEVEQLEELTKERISLKEDFATSALRRLTESENITQEWNFLQEHFSNFFTEKPNVKKLRETILQLAVQGKLTAKWRETNATVEHASELLKRIEAEKQQLIAEKKIKKEKPLPPIEDVDKPYDLPDSWIWCRMGSLTKFMAYGTSQKTNDNTKQVPVLRMGNITKEGKLHFNNLKYIPSDHKDLPKLYLENGDLVFNRTNSYELVGKSGVYNGKELEYTLASYLIKVSLFKNDIDSDYINNYLISPVCRKTQVEPQITAQTNQANFSGSKLRNVVTPLAPFMEQQVIVKKVNSLMALCDELEQQIDNSQTQIEQLMQSCLKEVFEVKEEVMI